MSDPRRITVHIHDEGEDGLWAKIVEMPGCFASGDTMEELHEALQEAIGLYLSTPEHTAQVELLDEPRQVESVHVTEQRVLVC
jgi:predicted RNase H-like HicB family nuclease